MIEHEPQNLGETPGSVEQQKTVYRPALVVTCGLPLTGKSTIMKRIVGQTNLVGFDVDEERFSDPSIPRVALPPDEEMKAVEASYARVFEKAKNEIAEGLPVIIAGVFSRVHYHNLARNFAKELSIPLKILQMQTPNREEIERRLQQRIQEGTSFSNVTTYEQFEEVLKRYMPFSEDLLMVPNTADELLQDQLVAEYLQDIQISA